MANFITGLRKMDVAAELTGMIAEQKKFVAQTSKQLENVTDEALIAKLAGTIGQVLKSGSDSLTKVTTAMIGFEKELEHNAATEKSNASKEAVATLNLKKTAIQKGVAIDEVEAEAEAEAEVPAEVVEAVLNANPVQTV